MANEIQASFSTGRTLYALIRGYSASPGLIWNGTTLTNYVSANYAQYPVSMAEQGAASQFYTGTFPATLPAGTYSVTTRQQVGGSPAESDPDVAKGNIDWGGVTPVQLCDMATSGQVSQFAPIRLARGTMIKQFPFTMVSSSDHVTPFTSGALQISGQISRDGGAFGALQSGSFSEIGLGGYALQALTSGDLTCNTALLAFTAPGADNRVFSMVLQRVSGQ